MGEQKTKVMTGRLRLVRMIYSEKTHNSFMYIIKHIYKINLDLFRKRRVRASEYQVIVKHLLIHC